MLLLALKESFVQILVAQKSSSVFYYAAESHTGLSQDFHR